MLGTEASEVGTNWTRRLKSAVAFDWTRRLQSAKGGSYQLTSALDARAMPDGDACNTISKRLNELIKHLTNAGSCCASAKKNTGRD